MAGSGLNVNVTVVASQSDDDDELTASQRLLMRSMLVESDFDVFDTVIREPPAGAKAADPVAINSLVVALAASGGALATLIGAIQAWLSRSAARHVVVEIDGDRLELNGVTTQERQRLTEAWLARHRLVAGESRTDGQ